jgi:hypothetical protein
MAWAGSNDQLIYDSDEISGSIHTAIWSVEYVA